MPCDAAEQPPLYGFLWQTDGANAALNVRLARPVTAPAVHPPTAALPEKQVVAV